MKKLLALFAVLLLAPFALAQTQIQSGPVLPTTCNPAQGQLYFVNTTTPGILYYCSGTNTWSPLASSGTSAIQFVIDGAGVTPGTGVYGQISMPVNCTIKGWVITADQSGSAVIDILRATYANFPSTASIAGSDKPTLSSAQKNQDSTLTGWGSTAITAGDQIQINLNSVATVTRINLAINITIP